MSPLHCSHISLKRPKLPTVRCLVSSLCCLLALCLLFAASKGNADKPVADPFILVGPGIDSPHLIFPSRYFFLLHQVDFESIKIRAIKATEPQADNCRLWAQVFTETQFCVRLNVSSSSRSLFELLDEAQFCDDEVELTAVDAQQPMYKLTVVRYKLYGQDHCSAPLEVLITGNGSIVHQRAMLAEGHRLYSDQCQCARATWAEEMQCTVSQANRRLAEQIVEDLKPFQGGIDFDSVLQQSVDRFAAHTRTYAFCLYQIISNQLYRRCFGEYVGFARFFDEMLLSLLRKTSLPDVEFVANLGDWPLSEKSKPPLPMFSWCGSTESYDIVLPTYELTESILHAQGRISTDILSTFGQQRLPFKDKLNKLFWRGRDSHRARLNLIKLAQSDPSQYNVSITNFFFFRDEMHLYVDNTSDTASGSKPKYTPFLDFFSHRYQLNIDGTVAAYRFPFLLAGSSLVLKQHSPYYEFFYRLLTSGTHYLPLATDLSDLPESLSRLVAAESADSKLQVKRIIWEARKFVLSHLLPEHVYCYYFNVIQAYAKLLTRAVTLRPDVQLVTLEEDAQPMRTTPEKDCVCQETTLAQAHSRDEL